MNELANCGLSKFRNGNFTLTCREIKREMCEGVNRAIKKICRPREEPNVRIFVRTENGVNDDVASHKAPVRSF